MFDFNVLLKFALHFASTQQFNRIDFLKKILRFSLVIFRARNVLKVDIQMWYKNFNSRMWIFSQNDVLV